MRSKTEVELGYCLSILENMQHDIDVVEANWPSSRRGSRAQRGWTSLLDKIFVAKQCAVAAMAEMTAISAEMKGTTDE